MVSRDRLVDENINDLAADEVRKLTGIGVAAYIRIATIVSEYFAIVSQYFSDVEQQEWKDR
jgi:hypothetical protein